MSTQTKKGYLRGVRGMLITPLNEDGSLPSTVAEVQATGVTGAEGDNNGLTYTAKAGLGIDGNKIIVVLQDPGAISQALSISVVDKTIIVSLATDGSGVITTTGGDLLTALQNDTSVANLVTIAATGASTGASAVVDETVVLSGGSDQQGSNYWVDTPEEIATTIQKNEGAKDTLRGGDQDLVMVEDPTVITGVDFSIKNARFDAKLASIIDGGSLIEDGSEIIGYTAPTIAEQATMHPFTAKVYVSSYNAAAGREAYLEFTFNYCVGNMGNITYADKSWGVDVFDVKGKENPSTLASVYAKKFVDSLPAEAG